MSSVKQRLDRLEKQLQGRPQDFRLSLAVRIGGVVWEFPKLAHLVNSGRLDRQTWPAPVKDFLARLVNDVQGSAGPITYLRVPDQQDPACPVEVLPPSHAKMYAESVHPDLWDDDILIVNIGNQTTII